MYLVVFFHALNNFSDGQTVTARGGREAACFTDSSTVTPATRNLWRAGIPNSTRWVRRRNSRKHALPSTSKAAILEWSGGCSGLLATGHYSVQYSKPH